jgi:hypothetical protein
LFLGFNLQLRELEDKQQILRANNTALSSEQLNKKDAAVALSDVPAS